MSGRIADNKKEEASGLCDGLGHTGSDWKRIQTIGNAQ